MKTKIKQVQDYLKNKLLSGEFEVEEIEEYRLCLIIDNEYKFTIWVGNPNIPDSRSQCEGSNFMMLDLSHKDRIMLHVKTKKIVSDYRKNILLASKRKELKRLQKELGEETTQS